MKNGSKEIRIADLFGGVGGFRLGIEKAQDNRSESSLSEGWNKNPRSSQNLQREGNNPSPQARCVFYCDYDKYAVQTYNKNFKENHKPTDIRTIKTDSIPDFDILCGGFPCQAFSIAGKRGGFQDTRGTLFFEIARIIKAKRPKLIFLENVKGLLNHENGQTFSIIIQTISELGYNVQWMVLNSKFFGVPQNRERVFIIGSLRGERKPEILPFGNTDKVNNEQNKELPEQVSNTLRTNYGGGYSNETYALKEITKNQKQIMDLYNNKMHSDRSPTLTEPHHNTLRVVSATKKGYSEAEAGDGIRLEYPQSKTARGRVIKGNSNTLKSGTEGVLTTDMKIRKLTPIECERLQGFPDGWTEGVSDTQRYKQMGNAVTVNVIEAIARKLI
jgi:DNA (cytosine-5)-methyltransferase 1